MDQTALSALTTGLWATFDGNSIGGPFTGGAFGMSNFVFNAPPAEQLGRLLPDRRQADSDLQHQLRHTAV